MSKLPALALSLALASATIAARAEGPPPPPSAKTVYVVAAMGDSLSDPKSAGGKYLTLLRSACPKSTFDTYGVGGNMVNMMRKRFLRDVFGEVDGASVSARPKYTHVVILGGIGDILSNLTAKRTAAKIQTDLAAMYTMTRDHGAVPIAVTLPPWGSSSAYDGARDAMTKEVNTWIRARDPKEAKVFDIYPMLSCGKAEHLCANLGMKDRLHWSEKGHDVVRAALLSAFFPNCA